MPDTSDPKSPAERTEPASSSEPREPKTPSWALVTGGSGRGGAAVCRALHARGLSVVIHHTPHSLTRAVALQSDLERIRSDSTRLWSADFASEAFGCEGVPAWLPELGISVLVCNASAYRPSGVEDKEAIARDIAIHVNSHAAILYALRPSTAPGAPAPTLRSVVAITDIAVDRPPKGHLSYTTAKGALQTMMLSLANDWAPYVRFNVVQPGTLPFPEDWTDTEREEKIMASIPLGRLGSYDDLAGAVVFFALDAPYVTGQVLAVDGGRSRQLH